MEIRRITLDSSREALVLLALQTASYRVEAQIVGLPDLPHLNEGIQSLQQSDEAFYGCFMGPEAGDKLTGAISCREEGTAVTICRLMVDPGHFRRGIARSLLRHVIVLYENRGASRFTVCTAKANLPAVSLYRSFGFAERRTCTIAPGIEMMSLERSVDLPAFS